MATPVRSAGNKLNLELGGQAAGPLRALQAPSYRLDRIANPSPGGTVIRTGGAVTLGEMAADFSVDQAGPLRDWVQRFASGDMAPQSGVAQVLDFNHALRRSLAFEAAEITQLRLPTLSAVDGRAPVLLGLSWRMAALDDRVGDGRLIMASKGRPKAMLASNFRVSGLPFDGAGITRVGLPLLRRVDTATEPRRSASRLGVLDTGELTLTVGGRSREKAQAWVLQVVSDGRLADKEVLDIVVELLDTTQKIVLATVTLLGCRLLACDEPLIETAADVVPSLVLRLAVGRIALAFGKD